MQQGATCSVVAVPRSDQLARVAVPSETWTAFRQAALAQGISVAAYLGRLVDAEVRRRDGREVAGISVDAPEPVEWTCRSARTKLAPAMTVPKHH